MNGVALTRHSVAKVSFLRRAADPAPGANCVVFLHGIGSRSESWLPLIENFAAEHEIIAWDAPGYGRSAPLAEGRPSPADYATALLRLLDELGLARVELVGHSLGCLFVGAFAAARPDRVSRLAFLSPALGYRCSAHDPLPAPVRDRLDRYEALGPREFAAQSARKLVAFAEAKPDLVARIAQAMSDIDPGAYRQAAQALAAGDLLADAARLHLPALVAVGALDSVTPPENARRLRAALPGPARYLEIPDCGHALPQDAPVATARALAEFLREARRGDA